MTPQQYRIDFDALLEPSLLLAADATILAANPAVNELGLDVIGIQGRQLAQVVAEPPNHLADYLRACSQSRWLVVGSMTWVNSNGTTVGLHCQGAALPSSDPEERGRILLRLSRKAPAIQKFGGADHEFARLTREVRRRRRAEREAKQQREWLQVTLASIGDGVITTDNCGGVKFLNSVAESLTGWTKEEAAGKPLEQVFRIVNEYSREELEDPTARVFREGAVVALANHTVLIARDGVNRPIDDSAAPIRDAEGTIAGAILVFRDVTDRKRAADALARLAAIVESSQDAIIGMTLDGVVSSWNRAAEQLFGYAADEVLGQSVSLIIPLGDLDELRWNLDRIRQGKRVDPYDTIRLSKDGHSIDVSSVVSPIHDDSGLVVGASKVVRGIADRKQAEAALRAGELAQRRAAELQASILNALPAQVAVVDSSGFIVDVNESWRRFATTNGLLSDNFLVGQNYLDVCQSATGDSSEEARQVFDGLRELLAGTRPRFILEYPCHSSSEMRWFRLMATPLYEDRREGAVIMHIDITERKLAEEALRRRDIEQRELAAMLTAAQAVGNVGSWETDLSTMVVKWSRQTHRIFETSPETFQPTHAGFLEMVHPEDRDSVDRAFYDSLREKSAFSIEHRILLPDGRIKTVEDRWQALHDDHGKPVVAVGTCQDVTERKRSEEALEQSSNRMEAMSRQLLRAQEDERRKIARELHDQIGQALTALKINLQKLTGSGEHARRTVESIEIVNQTLKQVRGMALDLRPSILDDLGLVAALEWFVSRHAERTGLEGRFIADPGEILAGPEFESACFRVAQEALTNVARHSRGTRFDVELRRDGGELLLVVRDNGSGFDPEAVFRAASSGASFGLVGMRERVQLAGGRLTVFSAPGAGSEIRAEFPNVPFVPRAVIAPVHSGRGG